MTSYDNKLKQLFDTQLEEWPRVKENFENLKDISVKEFDFDGIQIRVQFNPSRIVSSSAKTDKKSIAARKCFLCNENRPKEQIAKKQGEYIFLVNPFPIFPEHFTIPKEEHCPQEIRGNFGKMLELAKGMECYTVFYNGPQCGASAPDHFHFQAGTKNFMPIDTETPLLKDKFSRLIQSSDYELWAISDGLRNYFLLESDNVDALSHVFTALYSAIEKLSDGNDEPPMNILANSDKGRLRVIVFPRDKRRPWQYYEEGDKHLMISPASVEMGGLLITPLEKDFEKITEEDIKSIMQQVSIGKTEFEQLIRILEG